MRGRKVSLEQSLSIRAREALAVKQRELSSGTQQQRLMRDCFGEAGYTQALAAGKYDMEAPFTNSLVILPANRAKKVWDTLMLLLILYFAIDVPLRVCFSAPAEDLVLIIEDTFIACFWIDIFLSFNTAVFVPDGRLLVRRVDISRSYLSCWFWIDLLGSLPYSTLFALVLDPGAGGLDPAAFRFLRVLRLLRLVKVLRINALVSSIEIEWNVDLRGLRLLMLVIQIVYLAHVLACGAYLVADLSGRDGTPTWTSTYADGVAADPETPLSIKYLYSFYWALMTLTTVGYGDVTPANDVERLFTSAVLLVGGLVFGYMIGNVSGMMAQLSRQEDEVRDRMDAVKDYVAWRNMPPVLARRIKAYFAYYHSTRPATIDERDLLDLLTPGLRKDATRCVLAETIGRLPALQQVLDKDVQLDLFPLLKPCLYSATDVVYHRGDPADELIFLLEGQVSVISHLGSDIVAQVDPDGECVLFRNPHTLELDTVHTMPARGGCFGEDIFTSSVRLATAIATRPSKVLYMSRDDLYSLAESKPRPMRRLRFAILRAVLPLMRKRVLAQRLCLAFRRRGTPDWAAMVLTSAWIQRQHVCNRRQWAELEMAGMSDADRQSAMESEEATLGLGLPTDRSPATANNSVRSPRLSKGSVRRGHFSNSQPMRESEAGPAAALAQAPAVPSGPHLGLTAPAASGVSVPALEALLARALETTLERLMEQQRLRVAADVLAQLDTTVKAAVEAAVHPRPTPAVDGVPHLEKHSRPELDQGTDPSELHTLDMDMDMDPTVDTSRWSPATVRALEQQRAWAVRPEPVEPAGSQRAMSRATAPEAALAVRFAATPAPLLEGAVGEDTDPPPTRLPANGVRR